MSLASTGVALPVRTRTTARRDDTTHNGSYVAFNTSACGTVPPGTQCPRSGPRTHAPSPRCAEGSAVVPGGASELALEVRRVQGVDEDDGEADVGDADAHPLAGQQRV